LKEKKQRKTDGLFSGGENVWERPSLSGTPRGAVRGAQWQKSFPSMGGAAISSKKGERILFTKGGKGGNLGKVANTAREKSAIPGRRDTCTTQKGLD